MEEPKNIVIIGAGYGGITAALRLAHLFRTTAGYRILLIDRNPYHTLKTQLHEAAVHKSEVTIDVGRIIRKQAITFQLGAVTTLDLVRRIVEVGGVHIRYEYLVLAIGSQANFYNIPGLEENALPLQSASDAQKIYDRISVLCAAAAAETDRVKRKEMLRFVIGGGGLSGIEMAGELVDHVVSSAINYGLPPGEPEVMIVEGADDILPASAPHLRDSTRLKLLSKGVSVLTRTRVVGVSAEEVILSTGERVRCKTLVWTGGIRVSEIARESGFAIGESGRILVNEYLQSVTSPNVYAIGDNALAINPATKKPVPAAAQFALQQGRLVAENLFAAATGKLQMPYLPKVWGEVISLGRHLAVGWIALPGIRKLKFVGFLASLVKTAIKEKHIILLRKESRSWIRY
ncbi:MAG TPA: NAD(P)/FAD-dependent oxidoreductase [Bacteroidota bacterium]|nr:NAD(P)/FAD-dependent oxidoreductase [Bacteroidota bacterium]